jgi:hypothetical protein
MFNKSVSLSHVAAMPVGIPSSRSLSDFDSLNQRSLPSISAY